MDWRSERKNFKWSRGLQIEFTEVESMNDGAPVGLHGVEQGHIPAWGRTVQGPSSPDHWRWLPSHTKFWSCWALFIYLSIYCLGMDIPEEVSSSFLSFPSRAISFAKLLILGLIMFLYSLEKDYLHVFMSLIT